jgi:hypothetical protein
MKGVEYIEKQLGSMIADSSINISASKFYVIVNEAKELENFNSDDLIKMPCSFNGVMSENCIKCGMPEYMHIL